MQITGDKNMAFVYTITLKKKDKIMCNRDLCAAEIKTAQSVLLV